MNKTVTSGKRVLKGDAWHDDNGAIPATPDFWEPPMTDDEIDEAARSDPDNPPLSPKQLASPPRRVAFAKRLRWKLRMSREAFASAYGIPEATLRAWERHEAEPSPAELSYLRAIQAAPGAVRDAIREAARVAAE